MHFVGQDQRHGFERRLISDCTTAFVNLDWQLQPILGDLVDTPGYHRNGLLKSGAGHTGYHEYDKAVCQATVDWLKARGRAGGEARPFMMVAGFTAPHCPFVAPLEDYDLYNGRITEADLPDPHLELLHPALRQQRTGAFLEDPEPVPRSAERRARVAYYSLCTFLDRQLGRILDALESSGLAENTIVVYTSDHGEQLGEHGLWWKTTFYEGSVGVPLLISGPGMPGAGRVIPQNVSLMDVGPTLLDMVGAVPLPDADGRSFRCLIDGEPLAWADEATAECIDAFMLPPAMRMVRRGPWKLNYYHGYPPQLFNVQQDPGELDDRCGDPACRPIVEELVARALKDWDPVRMERRLAMRKLEMPLIRRWLQETAPPEPDPLWYKVPLENWYDPRQDMTVRQHG
jgi:choline-sulfatase